MCGKRLEALPLQTKATMQMSFPEMWKKRKNLQTSFWNAWRHDYLMKQSIRTKWQFPNEQQLLNKVVIMVDQGMSPNDWKLARITNVVYSNDNKIRSVEIKTDSGSTLIRPLQRLCLLENV